MTKVRSFQRVIDAIDENQEFATIQWWEKISLNECIVDIAETPKKIAQSALRTFWKKVFTDLTEEELQKELSTDLKCFSEEDLQAMLEQESGVGPDSDNET